MKKIRILLYSMVVLALIAIVAGKMIRQAKSDSLSDPYTGIIAVKGLVTKPESFIRMIDETGVLAGNKESLVAAETGGRVVEIKVEVGSFVKQGDPILRLDDELYRLESERAKIAFDKAKLDNDRLERLYAQKSISDSEIENARLGVKGAEVAYRMALKTYQDATVRAPFSGTIAMKMTEVGQMVERGVPVVQMVDVSTLKLTIQVAENMVKYVTNGATAQVLIDAINDSVEGRVTAVGSRAMTGSRTFPVEIRIPGNAKLRSGMFARAIVSAATIPDAILLPRAAILPDVGRQIVYLAKGKVAEKAIVKSYGSNGDLFAVEGLKTGDTVLTTGNQNLSHGSPIAVTLE
ncbi:MAG: efflux RND transporter periplasmic adaptor subunit [bacterium]|nr:efflux RND transporter periplasmic adaptor subunit [bacterium]